MVQESPLHQVAGMVPMVCPSTAAQQSDGAVRPDTVTETAPTPVLVVVVPAARTTAVTVSVDVKVSTA